MGDEPIEEPLDEEAWRYGESVEHILSELAREVRDGSPPVTRVMRRGLRCRLWTRSAALDPQRTPALGELAGAALEMSQAMGSGFLKTDDADAKERAVHPLEERLPSPVMTLLARILIRI